MAGLDRAFINEILSMAPYRSVSPLLVGEREHRRFQAWCAGSAVAARIVATGVYRECFATGAPQAAEESLFVSCSAAETIVRRLVRAYEDRALRRLLSRWRSRGADALQH